MKEFHISSYLLGHNREIKLPHNQFLIFNLVSQNSHKIFEIIDTNNEVISNFCKKYGKNFNIDQRKIIEISNQISILFD